MKIGIMGGTFDPIHNGHLMLGHAAYETFSLDQIWFMPNGNPPHKKSETIKSTAEDRMKMTSLAIAPFPEFVLQPYEALREEVSCSYQTSRPGTPRGVCRSVMAVAPCAGSCGAAFDPGGFWRIRPDRARPLLRHRIRCRKPSPASGFLFGGGSADPVILRGAYALPEGFYRGVQGLSGLVFHVGKVFVLLTS